jgi:malate dehydrogenase
MTTLALYGVGAIGGGIAQIVNTSSIVDTILMYDAVTPFLNAQKLDLMHAGRDTDISTDLNDFANSDICVFSAGAARNPNIKTRTELLQANIPVAREFLDHMKGFDGILITVSNPMDALNYFFSKEMGLDHSHFIGFGGQLDSARFTCALQGRGITEKGQVIGEHGERQVPVYSRLHTTLADQEREEILTELRGASMKIIEGKGGTVFGPTTHVSDIIHAICTDKKMDITCSVAVNGEYGIKNCSIGLPVTVNKNGVAAIHEWKLDASEQVQLNNAADFLQDLCRNL